MKTVYRSRIDWWLLLLMCSSLLLIFFVGRDISWWYSLIVGGGMTVLFVVLMYGCWYEIDGEDLVVYQFFRPHRMPVSKISKVKKTIGYLATASMSRRRVSISFIDRSVLKSFAPLEISPKDRDAFIAQLVNINPDIKVEN